MRLRLSMLLIAVSATIATAHEGHGQSGEGNTARHYLTQPLHVAGIVVIALVGVGLLALAVRKRRTRSAVRA